MIKRLITCLVVCLTLSGCWVQQTNTTIESDGSGVNEISFGFSQEFLSFVSMAGGGSNELEQVLSELGLMADTLPEEWNATSAPWESADGRYKGTSIRMEFSDLQMLEDQLAYQYTTEGNSIIAFEDVSVIEENGSLLVQARVTSPTDMSEITGMEDMESFGMLGMEMPVAVWEIQMPQEVSNWSEQELALQEGNRVTYTFPFPLQRDYDILVESPVGLLGNFSTVLVGLLAGMGLLLVGTGVFMLMRQRRQQPVAQPVGAWTPPPSPYVSRPATPSSDTSPLNEPGLPPAPGVPPASPSGRIPSQPLNPDMNYQPRRETKATQALGSYQPPMMDTPPADDEKSWRE